MVTFVTMATTLQQNLYSARDHVDKTILIFNLWSHLGQQRLVTTKASFTWGPQGEQLWRLYALGGHGNHFAMKVSFAWGPWRALGFVSICTQWQLQPLCHKGFIHIGDHEDSMEDIHLGIMKSIYLSCFGSLDIIFILQSWGHICCKNYLLLSHRGYLGQRKTN